MTQGKKRPKALLTLAQVMIAIGMLVTVVLIGGMINDVLTPVMMAQMLGISWRPEPLMMAANILRTVLLVLLGACLCYIQAQLIRICGWVRLTTAFSAIVVQGLGRIWKGLLISAALLLPLGYTLMELLTLGMAPLWWPVMALLPAFTVLTLAAMVRAVQLLLRRAVDMQEEQDLTV